MESCTFVPRITKYKKKLNTRQMSVAPSFNQSIAASVKNVAPLLGERKSSTNSMGVFDKLNKQDVRDYKRYEDTKNHKELKDCTFKPSIARKSVKLAMKAFNKQSQQSRMSVVSGKYSEQSKRSQAQSIGSRIETLYKQHEIKMKKHSTLKLLNEQKEMEQCTFMPNTKKERLNQQRDQQEGGSDYIYLVDQPSKIERNSSFQHELTSEQPFN